LLPPCAIQSLSDLTLREQSIRAQSAQEERHFCAPERAEDRLPMVFYRTEPRAPAAGCVPAAPCCCSCTRHGECSGVPRGVHGVYPGGTGWYIPGWYTMGGREALCAEFSLSPPREPGSSLRRVLSLLLGSPEASLRRVLSLPP